MYWLLITAYLVNAYTVMSRSAIMAFSLADAEELLRRKDVLHKEMSVLERFSQQLDDYGFTFLVLLQVSKFFSIVVLAQWVFADGTSIEIVDWVWLVTAYSLFVLTNDVLLRPICSAYAEELTRIFRVSWLIVYVITFVPLFPFRWTYHVATRFVRRGDEETPEEQGEDDIRAVVSNSEAKGQIGDFERDMIESVLDMRETTAEEIMTQRTDMYAISIDTEMSEIREISAEKGHSRIPVYDGNRDNIIGVLYVKDLLGIPEDEWPDLKDVLREAPLIPGTKPAIDVLHHFRQTRVHLAIVVDEYGGTAGLITLEDIIEEVFGDFEDEHDTVKEADALQIDEANYDIDARLRVTEVNERFGVNLPENELYESIGGLITTHLGSIPKIGEQWASDDEIYCLTVLESTDRRVVRVRLERNQERSVTGTIGKDP